MVLAVSPKRIRACSQVLAPNQLTHATGESKLPSLAKEGRTRHQVNGPVPLTGAARSVSPAGRNIKNGVVRSNSNNRWLERTTLPCFALSGSHSLRSCRLRELRWLREIFLVAQPPLLGQGGEYARTRLSLIDTQLQRSPLPSLADHCC